MTLQPHPGNHRGGWHTGTADALWRNGPLLREFDPDALVVLSADAVYRLDDSELVAEHRETGAVATMVTTRVAAEDAARYGVVRVQDGQVRDYTYKPEEPDGDLVSNEVFVFDPKPVLDELEDLAGQRSMTRAGRSAPRAVTTRPHGWSAGQRRGLPARPGVLCRRVRRAQRPVAGRRDRSCAAVVDSILLPGAVVRDDGAEIGGGAVVGGPGAVSLLGRREQVEADATIKAGARFPEDDPEEG